jgi:DNA-binding transcriptional LysR family regulator
MIIERMRDIHAFVHVAEAKSFTAAAERIGLSRSAVGKSVLRLEDRLGVRLLPHVKPHKTVQFKI